MDSARRVLAALTCATACQLAQADRSRLADNADVQDRGDCELETVLERHTARAAAPNRESSVRAGCGIGWRTELAAASARTRGNGMRNETISFEGKTSLREPGAGQIGWALVYGVGTQRAEHARWRRSESFAALEATIQPAHDWQLEARLGSSRDHLAHTGMTVWATAVDHAVTDAWEVRFEVEGDDRGRPVVSVGLRWLFWPEHALLSLSHGARPGPLRERSFGVGITFEF